MPRCLQQPDPRLKGPFFQLIQVFSFLFLSCSLVRSSTIALSQQQGLLAGVKVLPENILFVGNKSIPTEDLRAIFRNAGTVTANLPPEFRDTYNNDRIQHAIAMVLLVYRNRGFVKASVSPPEIEFTQGQPAGGVLFTIKISESNAYTFRQVKVNGTLALTTETALSILDLQPKAPVNLSKIETGIQALRETYYTLGYLDVAATSSLDAPDNRKVADIQINVTEGSQYHVGRLVLLGDTGIRESVLRDALPFRTGDIFGRKSFDACLDTLNEIGVTPVLTAKDVDFSYDAARALVDITIHLLGKKD